MASHPFILLFYWITEKINRIFSFFHKKTTENNYVINKTASAEEENVFLEDQDKETRLKYGSKSFSHSGCGTAAVFNALLSLGTPVPIADIIRHFEKHGASLFAAFGTAPQSAYRYLKKKGLDVRKSASRKNFRSLAESSDIIIFTIMNNRKKITRMLHTMCVERIPSLTSETDQGTGTFIVHNSHGREERYGSYDEMMACLGDGNGKADGVYMVGIRKEPGQTQPFPL